MSESATGTEPRAKTLLRRAAGAARLANALSTLLGLVQVAATILLALWIARTLDNAIYQPQPLLPDIAGWLQLAGILLLRTLAVYAQTLTGNHASLAIRNALREQALQQCFALNIRLFPAFKLAEISNLLTREIDNQRGYFADYIPQQRLALLMPLAILLAALTVNWMVALILLLTAPMVVVFMMLVGWKAADASRANLQALNRLGDLLADRLKNLQALQLAGSGAVRIEAPQAQAPLLMPQRIDILRASLRDNLCLHHVCSEADIQQALQLVELDDWAHSLPAGLDTWLGDGEWQPSGGEAKRIGLARLILQNPAIVLLDEPAAGMDAARAQRIFRRLAGHWGDKLVIANTHDEGLIQPGQQHLRLG